MFSRTTVDGVPINFPTHAHGQGYMDLNWVIPELIDYVTFRKGPYYADVGDFSSAGTAAFHLVKTLPEGLAKVGIGQDDYYRVLVAQTPKIGPGHLLYAFKLYFPLNEMTKMVGSLFVVSKIKALLSITQTCWSSSQHMESGTNLVTGGLEPASEAV